MRTAVIKFIFGTNRLLGSWPIRLLAWFISTGYFLFHRPRVASSLNLYRALYPDRGRLYHLYCTWRRFMTFADIFADRVKLKSGGRLVFTTEGREHLDEALKEGGGIFLMSHFGSWEIAAHLLCRNGHKLMILMGQKAANRLSRVQKQDMARAGLTIAVFDEEESSPLDMLELVKFMKGGGLVSSSGDMAWAPGVRFVPVDFLDSRVWFPSTPHFLAMITRVPLLAIFTYRLGRSRYHHVVMPPRLVRPETRTERDLAIRQSAQQYARELEQAIRQYPFQWFRFDPFPGSPPPDEQSGRS